LRQKISHCGILLRCCGARRALSRCTKAELHALLRKIALMLPELPENSQELRNAHANLQNIHRALARPAPASQPFL
jgi:hypothetical protein